LRGYIEEEPEHSVEGVAVITETYEETKETLKLAKATRIALFRPTWIIWRM